MVKKILRNLPSFYEEGTNNNLIADALIREFTAMESSIDNLKTQMGINEAEGVYLDQIGKLFNLGRDNGEGDSSYRSKILSFWLSFNKYGTAQDIITMLNTLTGIPESNITIGEGYSAPIFTVDFTINDDSDLSTLPTIKTEINNAKAAGTYYGGATFQSESAVLRTNLSTTAGGDKIL